MRVGPLVFMGQLDWFGTAAVILLALMLRIQCIVGGRPFPHKRSRTIPRIIRAGGSDPPAMARFDKVIAIAVRNSRSHMAAVVAAGLAAFSSAPRSH